MAYCTKCGTKLNEGMKYCPKCGTPCKSSFSQLAGESGVVGQKKSVPIKALLSVIIIIALLCGGWFFWKSHGNDYSLEGLAKACIKYDFNNGFHEGLAMVGKAEKIGYIDKNGIEVIPCIYDGDGMGYKNGDFHEGLVLVYKDGKYSYLKRNGEKAFSIDYEDASHFSEGLAFVDIGSSYGYIDTKGNVVFTLSKSEYSWGGSFSEGLAAVYNKNDKCGFIDSKGVLIIPMVYEKKDAGMEAPMFHDGLAPVKKDGKWGYIDKTGSEVIPFIFDGASDFSEGLASVYNKDYKHGYIDKTGNEVIPYMYNHASNFKDGLAIVVKDGGWGFIDKSGKEVVSCIYDFANDFNDGLAVVCKDDKYGYINKEGLEIMPSIYNFGSSFSEGLACVEKDGYWGYVDLHGKSTFDVENEEVKQLVQQKIKEKEEKKRGEEKKPSVQDNQEERDLSWLQGHWVCRQGNYEAHLVIKENTIRQYSSLNPESTYYTFTVDGNTMNIKPIKNDGTDFYVTLDYQNRRIDYGDGHWMHKVSLDSGEDYSSSTSSSNSQQRQRPFIDGQDIMARLYNQRFRHSSGLEIRIDSYGTIEIDGDPAGVLSILRFDLESALLRYGHGMYGEGKILLRINGNKLLLQDPVDGSLFYQR